MEFCLLPKTSEALDLLASRVWLILLTFYLERSLLESMVSAPIPLSRVLESSPSIAAASCLALLMMLLALGEIRESCLGSMLVPDGDGIRLRLRTLNLLVWALVALSFFSLIGSSNRRLNERRLFGILMTGREAFLFSLMADWPKRPLLWLVALPLDTSGLRKLIWLLSVTKTDCWFNWCEPFFSHGLLPSLLPM